MNRVRVTRLYRALLRQQMDWCTGDRQLYYQSAKELHDVFRERQTETSQTMIEQYIKEGMQYLSKYRHPNPYNFIFEEGGSKYQRNVPPEKELVTDDLGWGEWEIPPIEKST